jgi:hypothetical protein
MSLRTWERRDADARRQRREDRVARATQRQFPAYLNPAVPPVEDVAPAIAPTLEGPGVVALTPTAQPTGARAAAARGTAHSVRTTREQRGARALPEDLA